MDPSTSSYPPPPSNREPKLEDSSYQYADTLTSRYSTHPPSTHSVINLHDASNDTDAGPVASKSGEKIKKSGVVPRLRKACDSCSLRKVKCDESGPPCKACAALDIPCSFTRPSRRRGPPNRHAEAIKRQRLEDGSSHVTGSPTRDAAYGLAALSVLKEPPSAEQICSLDVLHVLIDDYFTYIHPLIPIPHETSFRTRWQDREDRRNPSFLALIAGMTMVLVSSFPRRARQIFRASDGSLQYPHASLLMERCKRLFNEARGVHFLDREDLGLDDACGSYFAAISAAYMINLKAWRLYVGECVQLLRVLGYHKARPEGRQNSGDLVEQQMGNRLFWLCFVGTLTVRQLGSTDADILLPNARSDVLPSLPLEVDDSQITPDLIRAGVPGEISYMVGFNWNVKIYKAFHAYIAIEEYVGQSTVFDWAKQKDNIQKCLVEVMGLIENIPRAFDINHVIEWTQNWLPDELYSACAQLMENSNVSRQSAISMINTINPVSSTHLNYPKPMVQREIQKANIYASAIATRSYLVERFWNLCELRGQAEAKRRAEGQFQIDLSSVGNFMANDLGTQFQHSANAPTDIHADKEESWMALERENIIRDMIQLLTRISHVNMEPNGHSLSHKIRQVTSTLLSHNTSVQSRMPTIDPETSNRYLSLFLGILSRLEHTAGVTPQGSDTVKAPLPPEEDDGQSGASDRVEPYTYGQDPQHQQYNVAPPPQTYRNSAIHIVQQPQQQHQQHQYQRVPHESATSSASMLPLHNSSPVDEQASALADIAQYASTMETSPESPLSALGRMRTQEEHEQYELLLWADLRKNAAKFIADGGYIGTL